MAELVDRVPAWSMTFVDETGSNTQMRGSFAPDTAADTALGWLINLASAVSPITGAVVVRASVSYRTAIRPVDVPETGATVKDQGVFVFQGDGDVLSVLSFAGILRSKLREDGCFAGEQIDLEDSDVSAFVDAITDGIWCDPFGADIIVAMVAYLRQLR